MRQGLPQGPYIEGMCGRFTLRTPQDRLVQQFGAEAARPRYNIAPTQLVFVVRGEGRELVEMRWGFASAGAGQTLINARSETAAFKPTFRDALRERRCLVPADGFYEWKREGGGKRPYFIHMKDASSFAFAGLWRGIPDQECFTILTTEANELLAPLHDRMPVIVEPADYDRWLDPQTSLHDVQALLRPYPSDKLAIHAVSSRVNSTTHDDPNCVKPHRSDQLLF